MTTAEILDLMLADENPLPAFAALDLVQTHVPEANDITDATYELFRAAGDRLERELGPQPEQIMQPARSPSLYREARESLRVAWGIGAHIVSLVKGNYVARTPLVEFRAALRRVPGLTFTGIRGTVIKGGFENWANRAERTLLLLEEIEIVESEVLMIAAPSRGK